MLGGQWELSGCPAAFLASTIFSMTLAAELSRREQRDRCSQGHGFSLRKRKRARRARLSCLLESNFSRGGVQGLQLADEAGRSWR